MKAKVIVISLNVINQLMIQDIYFYIDINVEILIQTYYKYNTDFKLFTKRIEGMSITLVALEIRSFKEINKFYKTTITNSV